MIMFRSEIQDGHAGRSLEYLVWPFPEPQGKSTQNLLGKKLREWLVAENS